MLVDNVLVVGIKCMSFGEFSHVPLFIEWILQIRPDNWNFFFGPATDPEEFSLKSLLIFGEAKIDIVRPPYDVVVFKLG